MADLILVLLIMPFIYITPNPVSDASERTLALIMVTLGINNILKA